MWPALQNELQRGRDVDSGRNKARFSGMRGGRKLKGFELKGWDGKVISEWRDVDFGRHT